MVTSVYFDNNDGSLVLELVTDYHRAGIVFDQKRDESTWYIVSKFGKDGSGFIHPSVLETLYKHLGKILKEEAE